MIDNDHDSSQCNHRRCAIPKLVLLIRMAAEIPPTGMTSQDVINTGLHNLKSIGISDEEIIEATVYLLMASAGLTGLT